jgi:lysophospholipase L1-like esterase
MSRLSCGLAVLCALWCVSLTAAPAVLTLSSNDVVAFVGGSDVAAAQFTGHLETYFAVKFPGARFRNFGWEGDTVYARPREINFPPLNEHLKRAGATVIVLQFGRTEVLDRKYSVQSFIAAYEKLLDECAKQTPRLVLATSLPFERGGAPLPDLSTFNSHLATQAEAIRALAEKRRLPLVDLAHEFRETRHQLPRFTDDGLQISPAGHALVAGAFARQLGFGEFIARAGDVSPTGAWANPQFEQLRAVVMQKNRFWFDYWRPQNWAFLGGDRTSQPSSRDHRDLKVRWFPAEMEKFVPLIRAKEDEMERLAAQLRGGAK